MQKTAMSSLICDNISGMVGVLDKPDIFIPVGDIKLVLSVYFSTPYHNLIAGYNDVRAGCVRAVRYDRDLIRSTGKNVFDFLDWQTVKNVIEEIEQRPVSVAQTNGKSN